MHTDFASGEKAFFTRLASYGYQPKVIYDVGASNGSWSNIICTVFPEATYHLFEPLSGNYPAYDGRRAAVLAAHPNFQLHPIALGNTTGTVKLHVTQDGYASSVHALPVSMAHKITVPAWRLDEYVAKQGLPPPSLLKMDVQGYEAFILEGAGALLQQVDVLFMETWLVRGYGPNTPLLTELIAALTPLDYVLVDVCGAYHDSGDYRRLTSLDAFFLSKRLLDQIKEPSKGWSW